MAETNLSWLENWMSVYKTSLASRRRLMRKSVAQCDHPLQTDCNSPMNDVGDGLDSYVNRKSGSGKLSLNGTCGVFVPLMSII